MQYDRLNKLFVYMKSVQVGVDEFNNPIVESLPDLDYSPLPRHELPMTKAKVCRMCPKDKEGLRIVEECPKCWGSGYRFYDPTARNYVEDHPTNQTGSGFNLFIDTFLQDF